MELVLPKRDPRESACIFCLFVSLFGLVFNVTKKGRGAICLLGIAFNPFNLI